MSTESNKAAVRRYHDAFSAGDLNGVTAVFALNAVVHTSSASWRLFDQMAMMQQLGFIPAPGENGS